jgi:hypothetical protein
VEHNGGKRINTVLWLATLNERDLFEKLGVEGREILKCK